MDVATFSVAWAGVSAFGVLLLMLIGDHKAAKGFGSLFRKGPKESIGRVVGWLIAWVLLAVVPSAFIGDYAERERGGALVGFSALLLLACVIGGLIVRRKAPLGPKHPADGESTPTSPPGSHPVATALNSLIALVLVCAVVVFVFLVPVSICGDCRGSGSMKVLGVVEISKCISCDGQGRKTLWHGFRSR